ncbi:hypothetical protein [Thauera sinica]|uniref:Uncharacterized protein n=1 Tax=Thauera sinica TaxID=2665146 RepID=A0ABW1AW96_9RHOO|nr:hypothetical protein [Thauera sp. K11]ATE59899.1 hypothetical protein CCZ27_08015 [Thauera sp. K11]
MIHDRARLASFTALGYIFVVLGGIALHFLNTGEVYTLKFSLLLPSTWTATLVAGVAAWGLWHRFRWAWWLGIAAALFQLVRMSPWLYLHHGMDRLPGFGPLLVLVLLLAFLITLLLPGTKAACTR